MNDRGNTIAGWVLAALIAVLGSSILFGSFVFKTETPKAGKQGYAIQGVEAGVVEAETPLPVLLAAADVTKGEGVFKKCTACHNAAAGGANAIGPNLHGVVGAAIGKGKAEFAYSSVLSGKGEQWTFDNLNSWLANPKKFAPGTKMSFAGLGSPEDRANVIVYLNAQGSNLPLPAVTAEAAPPADSAAPAAGAAPAADAKAAEGAKPADEATPAAAAGAKK
jgi:cytochrome c